MLRAQEEDPPCNPDEEQYEPTTVDVVLGNRRVDLVRETGTGGSRVIQAAPTVADIAGLGNRCHLDLPGDPLEPECTYAEDFAAIKKAGKAPAVTYAHIATERRGRARGEPGLVVQYWFYYYFNQFNDLHESDWEGMQITFDANTSGEAVAKDPDEIVLFQHSGGEKAAWTEAKVRKQGTTRSSTPPRAHMPPSTTPPFTSRTDSGVPDSAATIRPSRCSACVPGRCSCRPTRRPGAGSSG